LLSATVIATRSLDRMKRSMSAGDSARSSWRRYLPAYAAEA
jgi:hypothetical protein